MSAPMTTHSHNSHENFSLTPDDRYVLSNLTVPVPHNEQKRIETLRQSKLMESGVQETGFHRFTSLATRLFNMPFSAVSFIDVDSVVFKSKVGFDLPDLHRNEWFDAYTILPESSEVYVIPDCATDPRFSEKSFVKNAPKVRFYAGAAIMIDNVKIGVLSIMDVQPHRFFSLEDKENLLDLGAAAAQLAKEKLQTSLNLSTERANIVVSMMHHLRTPMTSLNFATSLLCNDVQQIKGCSAPDSTDLTAISTSTAKESQPQAIFQAFESSFMEINTALNQLNILVDSSLSLGQAIIKCSTNENTFAQADYRGSAFSVGNNGINPPSVGSSNSKFSECNVIDYLTDMFQHHLPIHNDHLEIEWLLSVAELSRGSHVTFPDALMLIVISTVSHMSAEFNELGFFFSFEPCEEEDCEYPELSHKMIEGQLAIKVFAKDGRSFASDNAVESESSDELPSKQNFLSIDKILRAINGSSREFVADINMYGKSTHKTTAIFRSVHEFCVPCKILLKQSVSQGVRSNNQEKRVIRFFRGKVDKTVTVTVESPRVDCQPAETENNGLELKVDAPNQHAAPAVTTTNFQNPTASKSVGESPSEPQTANDSKLLRALVIEDTIPVQKLLTRWLQNHGCSVTCANNGKIGLDFLTSNEFDIAFVDFLMPVMLGITTMKLFQEWVRNPPMEVATIAAVNKETLIIGMSATALESEQEEAFKFGMHFFCPKPVSLDLLTVILNAKRDSLTNEDAVNRIFSLTGSNPNPSL